jgi:hypothetical protein
MRSIFYISVLIFAALLFSVTLQAQCAVCTKTALQLGEKPAAALNSAIIYLMSAPFAIMGIIGYRWWKNNKKFEEEESRRS